MVVRFVTDTAFAHWLETEWEGRFEWDPANSEKLAKHGLTPAQVEALFENAAVSAGRIEPMDGATWATQEERHLVLLVSTDAKAFSLVCTRRGEALRPISCRRSRDEEQRFYENAHKHPLGRGV
jgi:uncharacterized DUF497 family protein